MPSGARPYEVEFDELTDLPNMLYFRRYAGAFLRRARRRGHAMYLIYFNIENFSSFNASYGFEEGDKLLRLTAVALASEFPGYLLSRISEDHFLLICESLDLAAAIRRARDQLHACGRGENIELKAGVCVIGDERIEIGVACDRAKAACDSISHQYDKLYRVYDESLRWYDERRHYIENNFERALDEGWIKVFYQPILRAVTGEVAEFEALARWEDPTYGMLSPGVFIEVLERARLIHRLDAHVVRLVCEQWKTYRDALPWRVPVSVNLSRLDFELTDAFEMIDSIAQQYAVPRQFLHVEVTESTLNDSADLLKAEIPRFREAGYQVWLDDFGSGYSSLNTLKDYVFDVVKIDMAFLREFDSKPQSRVIIASVVNMAKQLGMKTLIEGVETQEQFEFVCGIGCEFIQGYLVGRPVPPQVNADRVKAGDLVLEDYTLHGYYDHLGGVNYLSATPFEFSWDHVLESKVISEMPPLAILEIEGGEATFRHVNETFVSELAHLGLGTPEEFVSHINHRTLRSVTAILDAFSKSAQTKGTQSIDLIENGRHCVLTTRAIASHHDCYAFLLSLINLTRFQKLAEDKLLQIALHYLYSVYDSVNIINVEDGTIATVYRRTADFASIARGSDVAMSLRSFAETYVHPLDRDRYLRYMDHTTVRKRAANSEHRCLSDVFRMLSHDGRYQWMIVELLALRFDGDSSVLVCLRHINESLPETIVGASEMSKSILWDTLIDLVPAGLFWKDRDRRFVGVNRYFLDFYEFSSENDVLGKTDEDMGWHVDEKPFQKNELTVINKGEPVLNSHGTCISHGEVRDIVASKVPVWRNGDVVGLLGFFTDRIGDVVRPVIGDGFERLSHVDRLTGIANMMGLTSSMMTYEQSFHDNGWDFAYVVADIREMGKLNDVYGVAFGDRIIKVVARTLERACGVSGVVARIAGDRFALLFRLDLVDGPEQECERLRQAVEGVHEVDNIAVKLGCDIGWAIYSEHLDVTEMMTTANLILREARKARSQD